VIPTDPGGLRHLPTKILSRTKAPAQVCFWGTGKKKPAAKNMYRNSAINAESRQTDREGNPFFHHSLAIVITYTYTIGSMR
jgi:hypothetical protein